MKRSVVGFRRGGLALATVPLAGALMLMFAGSASAAIVPTVGMGTAANYSVLAGQGVTNVGNTTMHQNLGTSPNPAITGFPPGDVIAPGVIDNAGAAQGQLDLTTAYDNAAGRPLTAIQPANLTGLTLQGGVYAAAGKAPLVLPGTLTLDGANNPSTVFIFQTNSSLITGSGSSVSLINGAQECNVFWQVLSSATLGSGSTFVGNILALTSISMQANVTVHGRALARNGSVTLINDHFTNPTCATVLPPTTTTTVAAPVTTPGAPGVTLPGGGTATTIAPGAGLPAATLPGGGTGGGGGGAGGGAGAATTTTLGLTVGVVGPPVTGVAPLAASNFPWPGVAVATVGGAALAGVAVRRRVTRGASR